MRIDQAGFNWPWIYRTQLSNQLARDLSPGNQTYNKAMAVACNDLGDKSFANGEYREPAGAYQRALALFKYNRTYQWNTIQAWVGYGDQCLARYEYDEAIRAYRQAFEVNGFDMNTRHKLAGAPNARGLDYKNLEQYWKAARDFKEALRPLPGHAEYQANHDSVKAWDEQAALGPRGPAVPSKPSI